MTQLTPLHVPHAECTSITHWIRPPRYRASAASCHRCVRMCIVLVCATMPPWYPCTLLCACAAYMPVSVICLCPPVPMCLRTRVPACVHVCACICVCVSVCVHTGGHSAPSAHRVGGVIIPRCTTPTRTHSSGRQTAETEGGAGRDGTHTADTHTGTCDKRTTDLCTQCTEAYAQEKVAHACSCIVQPLMVGLYAARASIQSCGIKGAPK